MHRAAPFTEIVAWQRAIDLAKVIYKLTATFPPDERFGLVRQMRDAAISISSNIAEGYGRRTRGEYVQFVGIALGSLREVQSQIYVAQALEFVGDFEVALVTSDEVGGLIFALQRSLSPKQKA